MEDAKSTTNPRPGDAPAGRTRDEQATSDKTLADLEQTQTDSASGKGGSSSGTTSPVEGSSPAPDGAADSPRGGRADGSDSGGPM